jgi:hypothetical protein
VFLNDMAQVVKKTSLSALAVFAFDAQTNSCVCPAGQPGVLDEPAVKARRRPWPVVSDSFSQPHRS